MSLITMEMPKENLDPKISMPLSEYVKRILDTRDETIDRALKIIEERSYGGVNINYSQIKSDVLRIKTHWIPLLELELDGYGIKVEKGKK